jgi:hypothetical protein
MTKIANLDSARSDINAVLKAHFPVSELAQRTIQHAKVEGPAIALASAKGMNLLIQHASADFPVNEHPLPAEELNKLRKMAVDALQASGMGKTVAEQELRRYESEAAAHLAHKFGLVAPSQGAARPY